MKIRTVCLLASLACAFALPLAAKVATNYLPRSGDAALDSDLIALDEAARASQSALIDAMVSELGAPRYLLREYLGPKRWAPGDVYCACAIAYQLQRPCLDMLREYEPRRSEGWSAFVRSFGLLPGTSGFDVLKERIGKARARLAPAQAPEASMKQDVAADAPPAKEGKK
ncbi:hypothetical protein [Arenimonas sp.]|uniref:hypothetical protein n=1 Tax=Arenimonas sp. TaxID=1872635 RepID=UPI0039E2BF8B